MEKISINLHKYKKVNTKIFTKEQSLAEEIWLHLGKELPFPRIMRIIKVNDYQKVYEVFQELKKSPPKNPVALFIWKFKK